MDASITDRYIRRGRPGVGGTRMGGLSRYFLTLSNAFWQSSFLVSIFLLRSAAPPYRMNKERPIDDRATLILLLTSPHLKGEVAEASLKAKE